MAKNIYVCLLILLSIKYIKTDVVVDLPGLPGPSPFKIYSGYLDGYFPDHKIHYIFVESEEDPANDPVLLWLNGGPGCSSMEGFLTENGPYTLQKDGETLEPNPYSWNKVANVLYLETPVGVGFSYINGSTDYSTDDDQMALEHFHVLEEFYEKFPSFQSNELFLTGESYAGIYIPLLSQEVSKHYQNFQGFMIVNGLLDYNKNFASKIFYLYYHGLISENLFLNFTDNCCNSTQNMKNCNIFEPRQCRLLFNFEISSLNAYNIYKHCENQPKFVIGNEELPSTIPCVDSSHIEKFLNNETVQTSLNVELPVNTTWNMCNLQINSNYYNRTYKSTEKVIYNLLEKHRGMIVNGDVDSVCNFLGNEWSFDNLGIQNVGRRFPYKIDNQLSGFTKSGGNLTFVTVKGAGHMVPEDKPKEALWILKKFIDNTSFFDNYYKFYNSTFIRRFIFGNSSLESY